MNYLKAYLKNPSVTLVAIICTILSFAKIPQWIADADADETHWLGLVGIILAAAGAAIGCWLYPIWDILKKRFKTKNK